MMAPPPRPGSETAWRLLLFSVLALAAALRLYRLDVGIPFAIGIDEPEVVGRAVQMMRTGDFNPHFFDYPSLTLYLHMLLAIARFIAGAAAHEFTDLRQVDVTDFLLWSRALTAAMGVGTVYVTYRVGLHWDRATALLAALLLAVAPMSVREARFALTDTPLALGVAATLWASLVAHQRRTSRSFVVAGAVAGLAMGIKYTAGLAVLLPLIAAWGSAGHPRVRFEWTLRVVVGWVLSFLIVAPYTVLDLPAFLNGFAGLMTAYRPRPMEEPAAITYLKHLRITLGWPAALALGAGVALAAWHVVRGPARTRWALLVAFPALYFLVISRQSLIFGRYLLPMLPGACLLVSVAVMALMRSVRVAGVAGDAPGRTLLVAGVLVALIVVPPGVTSATILRQASRTSTQAEAYRWLVTHAPDGAVVAVEKSEVRLSGARYRPVYLTWLTDRTYEEHALAGTRYLVATSQMYGPVLDQPQRNPPRYKAYMTLFAQVTEVARFTPKPGQPGPEIVIYEMR